MNGFVSVPPAPIDCPGDEACAATIAADGFFPAVDMHALRETMRVGTMVTDARLREAVIAGMTTALRELAAWRTEQVLAGYPSVDLIMGQPRIDGQNWYAQRWRRAVYNYACAELAETHRDVSATGDGSERAEAKALSADDYRRDGLHAVRDILAVPRIHAELI
ncbi:MAG: head completion/stabilization protein [Sphingobium sp.]|uniref:head completion/stabilization protein n=1 Tax=Sphingobium sp. TaxID=1912891 RepID=UPI003BB05C0B